MSTFRYCCGAKCDRQMSSPSWKMVFQIGLPKNTELVDPGSTSKSSWQHNIMSKKRKRHEHDDESAHIATNALNDAEKTSEEDSVLLGAQEIENVRKKLHYCSNLVSRGLKKACGFEVQKIIKRMKAARYSIPPLVRSNFMSGMRIILAESFVLRESYSWLKYHPLCLFDLPRH